MLQDFLQDFAKLELFEKGVVVFAILLTAGVTVRGVLWFATGMPW